MCPLLKFSQLRTAAANRDELQKEKETLTAKLAEAETARCMAEADATSEKERANKLLTDLSKAELKVRKLQKKNFLYAIDKTSILSFFVVSWR